LSVAEISVMTGGFFTFLIAVFHTRFYSIFRWKIDFEKISFLNSRIHYTIHLALLLILSGLSILSFIYSGELAKCTGLGLGLMVMASLLWLWRTIWQIAYFSPTGKDRKLQIMHHVLILVFGITFIAYTIPIIIKFI